MAVLSHAYCETPFVVLLVHHVHALEDFPPEAGVLLSWVAHVWNTTTWMDRLLYWGSLPPWLGPSTWSCFGAARFATQNASFLYIALSRWLSIWDLGSGWCQCLPLFMNPLSMLRSLRSGLVVSKFNVVFVYGWNWWSHWTPLSQEMLHLKRLRTATFNVSCPSCLSIQKKSNEVTGWIWSHGRE